MFFIDAYAKLVYYLTAMLMRTLYKGYMRESFSSDKHDRMFKLSKSSYGVFNAITSIVGKNLKDNYLMSVNYEGCKLLIRPFSHIVEIIMVSGLFEPYVKAIFDKEVRKTDVIVIVGANIGVYAVPLAKKVNKIIAFEPHPKISNILEKNIKLNELDNVLIIKEAVSDSEKKVLLDLSYGPSDAYSKIYTPDSSRIDSAIVNVKGIDLDTALAMEYRIDWLLIDVDDHEINVLNGARNILRKFYPKIIIEVMPEHVDNVNSFLMKEGYSNTTLHSSYESSYHYARRLDSTVADNILGEPKNSNYVASQ